MNTKTLTGSSHSLARLGLPDDHPLSAARALARTTAKHVAVITAMSVAGLAGGWDTLALAGLVVAAAFASIGGGLALARYRTGLDRLIVSGRVPAGVPALIDGFAASPRRGCVARLPAAFAHVSECVIPGILAAYAGLAQRLEAPDPVSGRAMLRLIALLQTAPSTVAVGSADAVVRELAAISFLFDGGHSTFGMR